MPKNFVSYDNAEDLMGGIASHIDDRAEQKEVDDISNVYGAKNLIPYPYYTVDGVYNDITFSTDEDGRINVSGTASANTNLSLISNNDSSNWIYLQDGITYKFVCSEPYDGTEFNISARVYHSDGTYQSLKPGQTYTAVEGDIVKYCTIWISKDVTIRTSTNVEVMICAASIKDDTYQPYTMTNKQLTDNARGIDIEWSDYVNLTDVQRSNNHYIIHNAPKSGIVAADIAYDNTTSELSSTNVKGAIDELAKPTFTEAGTRANIASGEKLSTILGKIKKWFTDLADMFVSKSGDTMSGTLTINSTEQVQNRLVRTNSSTTSALTSLEIGNNKADGTSGSAHGSIILYGKNAYYTHIRAYDASANRNIDFPNKGGTIALTSDIKIGTTIWTNTNPTADFAATSLTLDLSDCDYIRIICKQYKGSQGAYVEVLLYSTPTSMNDIYMNNVGFLSGGIIKYYQYYRSFNINSSNYLSISPCNYSTFEIAPNSSNIAVIQNKSSTVNNAYIIPYKIIKCKW